MSVNFKDKSVTMASDGQVNELMQRLNVQWRNYVSKICGLDSTPGVFQVAQGNLGGNLGGNMGANMGLQTTDSSGLFLMADTVPTDSPTGYYQNSSNRRSTAYKDLLFSMAPQDTTELRKALGVQYVNWITYRKSYYANPKNKPFNQQKLFEMWANANLDLQQAQKSISVFGLTALSPLNKAIDAYNDKANQQSFFADDGEIDNLYSYTGTIEGAQNVLDMGLKISQVNFDTATATTRANHDFTEEAVGGFYDFFEGEAGANFEQLNAIASNSRITITGHINKTAQLLTQPAAWYDSGVVGKAYNHPVDNIVWMPKVRDDWDSFFKQPNGTLARYISSLLLVSDYELTVTIHAKFSESQFTQVKTEATVGIWPFFGAEGVASHNKKFKHNEDNSLSYTISLNKGLIGIWGLNYRPAP